MNPECRVPGNQWECGAAKNWIKINLKIGALSIGSSGRTVLYQDAVVTQQKWMSDEEFQEALTLTAVLPGPNLVNLCVYLGLQITKWQWMLLGLLGLALPGALLVVWTWQILPFDNPDVVRMFQGFSIGSVSLFTIYAFRLFQGLKSTGGLAPKITSLKYVLRCLLAATAFGLSLYGISLILIIFVGVVVAAAMEFGIK